MKIARMQVFEKGSKKASLLITHVMPIKVIEAANEELGKRFAKEAEQAFGLMQESNVDLLQKQIDDKRVRFQFAA